MGSRNYHCCIGGSPGRYRFSGFPTNTTLNVSPNNTTLIDYWHPDVRGYVFNNQIIDLEAELGSTLAINEAQQLIFGTLFAYFNNTVQAVLTLSPSGSYSINEPGNSRLVSITKPSQGIIRVSGAAPQTGDVLLEHTTNPGSAGQS